MENDGNIFAIENKTKENESFIFILPLLFHWAMLGIFKNNRKETFDFAYFIFKRKNSFLTVML